MGARSHLTSLLFAVNHEYGTAPHINGVTDIPRISYGVSCICVGAAHLLMNVNDMMARTRESKRDGGYFGVTHDRFLWSLGCPLFRRVWLHVYTPITSSDAWYGQQYVNRWDSLFSFKLTTAAPPLTMVMHSVSLYMGHVETSDTADTASSWTLLTCLEEFSDIFTEEGSKVCGTILYCSPTLYSCCTHCKVKCHCSFDTSCPVKNVGLGCVVQRAILKA